VLGTTIHFLQVHNKFYCNKIDGLCGALTTRQRHKGKGKPLDLQQCKEFCRKAVFYSPSTVCKSFVRKDIEQHEAKEEKLQKKYQKELKAVHNLYQSAAEERKKEKEAKAKKQQERKAATY
jgi:transketolase